MSVDLGRPERLIEVLTQNKYWTVMVAPEQSEERLPVHAVSASLMTRRWKAELEFGYVFDGRGWVMAAHDEAERAGGSALLLYGPMPGLVQWREVVYWSDVKRLMTAQLSRVEHELSQRDAVARGAI